MSTTTTEGLLFDTPEQVYNYLFTHSGRKGMYTYQQQLMANTAKFVIINKSRQIGISSFLACDGLVRAAAFDEKILVVSPSERQSKHVMDYVGEFWRAWQEGPFPPDVQMREETKHSILFDKGEMMSLPNSSSTIRGFPADRIYMDEFAHFLNGTDRTVFEAVTPSVSRGGMLYLVSTPFGDNNMFAEIWRSQETDKVFKKILIPYTSCPDLDIEAIRTSGAYDDASFRQEFNNEFVGEMTSEIPMSLILPCVDGELELSTVDALQGKLCVGGYDVARDVDLSVIHVYEVLQNATQDGRDSYVLRCKYVWRGIHYEEQFMRLTSLLGMARFKWFNMDATAEKALHERVRTQYSFVRGVHFTNDLKAKLVGNLKRIYQDKRVRIPDDQVLIRAVNSIQRKYSDTNYLKFDAARTPETGHADEFWAQAMALYPGDEWQVGVGTLTLGVSGTRLNKPNKDLIRKFVMEQGGMA